MRGWQYRPNSLHAIHSGIGSLVCGLRCTKCHPHFLHTWHKQPGSYLQYHDRFRWKLYNKKCSGRQLCLYIKADGLLSKGFANTALEPGENQLSRGALIIGDVDNAGGINIDDLTGMLSAFGDSTGDPNFIPFADLNCDGAVNIDDLTGLLSNFGAAGDVPGLVVGF